MQGNMAEEAKAGLGCLKAHIEENKNASVSQGQSEKAKARLVAETVTTGHKNDKDATSDDDISTKRTFTWAKSSIGILHKTEISRMVECLDYNGLEYAKELIDEKYGQGSCCYNKTASDYTHKKLDLLLGEYVKTSQVIKKLAERKGDFTSTYHENVGQVNWLTLGTTYLRFYDTFPLHELFYKIAAVLGYA